MIRIRAKIISIFHIQSNLGYVLVLCITNDYEMMNKIGKLSSTQNENLNLVELEFNSIRYKSNSIHSKFKIQFNLHAMSFNIFIFFHQLTN
jgi:hypothetical protein